MLAVLVLVCGAAALGGCSPSQQAWVDRCQQGVTYAQQNQTAWYYDAVAQLNKDRQRSIQVAFAELQTAFAGGIHDAVSNPSTQPGATSLPAVASATTRPVDSQWILDQERVLLATMKAYDERKADLDAKYSVAMSNLGSISEGLTQIERLNVAWADTSQQLSAQISNLAKIVESRLPAPSAAPVPQSALPSVHGPILAQGGSQGPGKPLWPLLPVGLLLGLCAVGSAAGGKNELSMIQQAIGMAWDQFKASHPQQAMDVESEFGNGELIVGLQQELAKDQAYQDLLKETNLEVTGAALAQAILPILENVVAKFI